MATTIANIAEVVGVAGSTVSKVLNNSNTTIRVSSQTREKILRVAKEMNYRPSFLARTLATGKTFTLGFLCGDMDTPFFAELGALAMHEAELRGYHLLIASTEWNPAKELDCLSMFLERRVDGILLFAGSLKPETEQYDFIVKEKIPVVTSAANNIGLSSVSIDFQPGFNQAVEYLKSKGHECVTYVSELVADELKTSDVKTIAFERACKEVGMKYTLLPCPLSIEYANELGQRLGKDPDRPKAIIVSSDYRATGIISGLFESGVRVPDDVAVVGIDGTRMGRYFCPPLTTIAADNREIIIKLMDILIASIENKDTPHQSVSVPTKLVIRHSA